MNLDFDSLELANCRSFKQKTRLNLQRLGAGLHFVCGDNQQEPRLGSNGAGKSTLWNALCWCWYGKTVANLNRLDLTPWDNGGEPAATVLGRSDDTEFAIECTQTRKITPSGTVTAPCRRLLPAQSRAAGAGR